MLTTGPRIDVLSWLWWYKHEVYKQETVETTAIKQNVGMVAKPPLDLTYRISTIRFAVTSSLITTL